MKTELKISWTSRLLLIVAAVLMALTPVFPLWKIELYAPQYPEGLLLLIYASKLAGNVEIINGLNHYIGMQTLDAKNFIEFSFLPYLLIGWGAVILGVSIIGRKKWATILLIAFTVFSLVAMLDFYRWNYNYGHNLDPNAAIIVPGMSYQPPMLGYKQLLNFGAYALPALGGLLYIGAGLLMLIVFVVEHKAWKWLSRKRKVPVTVAVMSLWLFTMSCSGPGPRPVHLNKDACDHCRMTIMNPQFPAQLVSQKGRQYVFDDISCMVAFRKDHPEITFVGFYVSDFSTPHAFLEVEKAAFIQSPDLHSPMGGNTAAFASQDSARIYQAKFNAQNTTWPAINK